MSPYARVADLGLPGVIHVHPRASPHRALDFSAPSSYLSVKCVSVTHRQGGTAVSRLDLCCDNRGSDLASRPDHDWQAAPAGIPHHVAGSWPCSRARLSIPNRCTPIEADSHERSVALSLRSRLMARPLRSPTPALSPPRWLHNASSSTASGAPAEFPRHLARALRSRHLRDRPCASCTALSRHARGRRTRGLSPRAKLRSAAR